MMFFKFAFAVGVANAARLAITSPNLAQNPLISMKIQNDPGLAKLLGNVQTCFSVPLSVEGKTFNALVDTGSTDFAVPNAGINNYYGPTLNMPQTDFQYHAIYGSGSWTGYLHRGVVSLNPTITAPNAPYFAVSSQSNIFDGVTSQGLLGVAYDSLALTPTGPRSVMDAWIQVGALAKNEISFHACPLSLQSEGYVDFGNEDPSFTCNPSGTSYVWAYSPSVNYYTINIVGIKVGGSTVNLPKNFQKYGLADGSQSWSLVDSCTSVLLLPKNIVQSIIAAIVSSGGIPSSWSQQFLTQFFNIQVLAINPDFKWDLFPTISIQIQTAANSGETFEIVLSAREYIQEASAGRYQFLVMAGDDARAILGIPVFTGFEIVFDRANTRVGFGLGCGCSTSTVKYPDIIRSSGSVWNHIGGSSNSKSSSSSTMSSTKSSLTASTAKSSSSRGVSKTSASSTASTAKASSVQIVSSTKSSSTASTAKASSTLTAYHIPDDGTHVYNGIQSSSFSTKKPQLSFATGVALIVFISTSVLTI